ncbi:hypothetical protein [Lederbergia citri]|uniref:SbsC C-terminal domain-containing protein n=1 Tax=Lederbergia citri TaxID=2833580 RepID=A0A942YIX2_9BACI|nr:hypothetical protein [Lederbergia citri]MBS4195801.1 hypothetical protein [Lederbergia citri]
MSKKKVAKLGISTAIAASALIAANPADAASVSQAETLVKQAESLAKQLRPYYSAKTVSDVKVSADFSSKYDETRKAITRAQNALSTVSGKEKANLTNRIANAEALRLQAAFFIDAVKVGDNELKPALANLKKYITTDVINADADKAYSKLTDTLLKMERVIGKAYGPDARQALLKAYVTDAKIARETVIYEVSQYRLLNDISKLVASDKLEEADAELAKLDRLKVRAVAIKEAGNKLYPGSYPALPGISSSLAKTEGEVRADLEAKSTPKVVSVSAINARNLEVKFNKAIDSTPANLAKVAVSARTGAVAPGSLAYTLSNDGKTLTISTDGSSNMYFKGDYNVVVGYEDLKTADGEFVAPFSKVVNVTDNVAPTFTTQKVSASVYKVKFSEPMYADIASKISFKDKNGAAIAVGTATNEIKVAANAAFTELTLTVGSAIAANENITATIIGALDASGNLLSPNPATFTFQKGAADGVKPVVQTITQTGAENFTVKFSEELLADPTVRIGKTVGGLAAVSSVTQDEKDKTLYHVEAGSVLDTDNYYVEVSSFTDLSGEAGDTYTTIKSFVKDTAAPTVASYQLVKDATDNAEYLELTFNKDVTAGTVDATGTAVKDHVTTTLTGSTGTTVALKNASVNKKVVKIKVADILSGAPADDIQGATYNVKLAFTGVDSASGVTAADKNVTFVRGNDSAVTAVKAKVQSVAQGADNDTVVVTFDQDVDPATATVASNYHISGAVVKSATVKAGAAESKKVYLTLEKDSNTFTGVRNATISGVKAKNSTAVMDTQTIVTGSLNENVAPTITSVKYDVATELFTFTFSEAVKQAATTNADFEVYVDGAALDPAVKFDAGATTTAATTATSTAVSLTPGQKVKSITLVGLSTIDLTDSVGNAIKLPASIVVTK